MLSQGRHCSRAVALLQVNEACTDERLSSTEVYASFNFDCSADHFCRESVWASVSKDCAGLRSVDVSDNLAGRILDFEVSVVHDQVAGHRSASLSQL